MFDNINWFEILATAGGLVMAILVVYIGIYFSYNKKFSQSELERNALIDLRARLIKKSRFQIKQTCIIPKLLARYLPSRSLGKAYTYTSSTLNPGYSHSIWYVPSFAVTKLDSLQELKTEYTEFCQYLDKVIPLLNAAINSGQDKIDLEGHTFNITVIKELVHINSRKSKFPADLFNRIVNLAYIAFREQYKPKGEINPLELEEHLLTRIN